MDTLGTRPRLQTGLTGDEIAIEEGCWGCWGCFPSRVQRLQSAVHIYYLTLEGAGGRWRGVS